ncbi:MAG: serine hydrolase, partial [Dermatophilaceae bacterium]
MPVQHDTAVHLRHVLARAQRDGRLPSVVAGLVRDGDLVWHGAAGTLDGRAGGEPADEDTQYRMGSITKTFVAVCV